MRPAEARAWLRANIDVDAQDLSRLIVNGKQSIFENDVHWARFYLAKAGLIGGAKRGLWGLTSEGRNTNLSPEDTWALYVRIRDANRPGGTNDEDDLPAPMAESEGDEDGVAFWFVGATWNRTEDQMHRFFQDKIWQSRSDEYSETVGRMKPGDLLAVKATFVQRYKLPFDAGGKQVSTMRIKVTGTVLENPKDGRTVKVAWDPPGEPRDWYFYTYRTVIVEADKESESARRLIDFTFRGVPQDYEWFLAQPYWFEKYGVEPKAAAAELMPEPTTIGESEVPPEEEETQYTAEDIIDEGCFLTAGELNVILERWRSKKNLILQGPPGTGKTWLAKRLGFALVGSKDRETARSRLRVVQFHPSLAYEDFVRGWRPGGDGKLALVDGILMQAIEAAASEPDRPFVLVIEEINRGNPAQIFGEMLTLLEDSKRRPSEALELAYRKAPGERVHVPGNLYVIGTMNVADRSLAIVDLALRRRFAFVDLEPRLAEAWRSWCEGRGLKAEILTEIKARLEALNADISSAISLGPQFRIGHSYVTPDIDETIHDGQAWFKAKVDTEIRPLLAEYWYDDPKAVDAALGKLLAGFA